MSNKLLSKTAQRVQDVLVNKGFTSTVFELPSSTRTAQDAAHALGCKIGQIVKSLIFRTHDIEHPILILASGTNRVNEKKVSKFVGELLIKADASFVRDVTGFAIGGIPPVGHTQEIKTFIDEDLLQYPTVWAAAGTPNAVFELDSNALKSLTGGIIISLS